MRVLQASHADGRHERVVRLLRSHSQFVGACLGSGGRGITRLRVPRSKRTPEGFIERRGTRESGATWGSFSFSRRERHRKNLSFRHPPIAGPTKEKVRGRGLLSDVYPKCGERLGTPIPPVRGGSRLPSDHRPGLAANAGPQADSLTAWISSAALIFSRAAASI